MSTVEEPTGTAGRLQDGTYGLGVRVTETDDCEPVGFFPDGLPEYAPTEVDQRFGALLDHYDSPAGNPEPERMAVADAFCAITAPDNLAHADLAVETLDTLVTQRDDPAGLKELLGRYGNLGLNPDRKVVARGLNIVVGNPEHAQEAVAVLRAMVELGLRRSARLAELGIVL